MTGTRRLQAAVGVAGGAALLGYGLLGQDAPHWQLVVPGVLMCLAVPVDAYRRRRTPAAHPRLPRVRTRLLGLAVRIDAANDRLLDPPPLDPQSRRLDQRLRALDQRVLGRALSKVRMDNKELAPAICAVGFAAMSALQALSSDPDWPLVLLGTVASLTSATTYLVARRARRQPPSGSPPS